MHHTLWLLTRLVEPVMRRREGAEEPPGYGTRVLPEARAYAQDRGDVLHVFEQLDLHGHRALAAGVCAVALNR